MATWFLNHSTCDRCGVENEQSGRYVARLPAGWKEYAFTTSGIDFCAYCNGDFLLFLTNKKVEPRMPPNAKD